MSGEAHYLKVEKTARYYSSGPLNAPYEGVCFCLHGYGQLAQFFMRRFQHKALHKTLFIAPEGFHRFYLQKSSGRVGASWMTKEDRLNDISDYVRFLDTVYMQVQQKLARPLPAGVLGFSQGAATACRWVAQSEYSFDYLINWAGAFPPDLNFEQAHSRLSPMRVLMALGNADEFISEEKLQSHLAFLKERGFSPQLLRFTGKHDLYEDPLWEALQKVSVNR